MRRGSGDRQDLFNYVTVPEAPEYRAIVDVFADAAAEYRASLSVDAVDAALRAASPQLPLPRDVLERRLKQLSDWRNLDRDRDESWATDLRTYERRAYLYSLSREGELAHEAVVGVEETLLRSVGLRQVALLRVLTMLKDLVDAVSSEPPEGVAVHNLVEELDRSFKALTGNSQSFLQRVNRILTTASIDADDYRLFKADTLFYLTEFIDRLEAVTAGVLPLFDALDGLGHDRLAAALAAGAKESGDRVIDNGEIVVSWAQAAAVRIAAVRRWFVSTDHSDTGVERLHRVVRRAVLGITETVERLRDARMARSGRTEHLLALARRFRSAPDDETAHRIVHTEFGLGGSRHFVGDGVDETVPYSTSWWDAPAPRYALQLKARSQGDGGGVKPKIADHGPTKPLLAELARKQHEAAEKAIATLVSLGSVRVSEVTAVLDLATLRLLRTLLNHAEGGQVDPLTGARTVLSTDGRLHVRLTPADPPTATGRIASEAGRLTLQDYEFEITRTSAGRRRAAAEERSDAWSQE